MISNNLKFLFLFLFFLKAYLGLGQVNPNHTYVNGYYRSDGTYVSGYQRTERNNTNTDNFSTKPNVNPYTEKKGYIEPKNNSTYVSNSNYSYQTNKQKKVNRKNKTEEYKNYKWKVDSRSNINGIYINMPYNNLKHI